MTTYYLSDPHFWHLRANELCGRPWSTVEDMNEGLIERINSVVGPSDILHVLGDAVFGTGTPGHLDIIKRVNGIKILTPGNHDRCHPMEGPAKAAGWRDKYLAAGFDDVTGPEFRKWIAGQWVWFSHFPYDGDSHDQDRFDQWRLADHGLWVVHGHTHGKWQQRGRQIDVGVDAWNGYPVLESELVARIYAGPTDRPPMTWQPA